MPSPVTNNSLQQLDRTDNLQPNMLNSNYDEGKPQVVITYIKDKS